VLAPEASATKPCRGSISVSRWPMVRMIRQPPTKVPSAIALAAATFTHSGTAKFSAPAWFSVPMGDEREGDDAHRLLGVVGPVRERHQ
jgi:hypothetical protein